MSKKAKKIQRPEMQPQPHDVPAFGFGRALKANILAKPEYDDTFLLLACLSRRLSNLEAKLEQYEQRN